MVHSRTDIELNLMRQSGKIAAAALKIALDYTKEGASGLEIDKLVTDKIYSLGGDLSYKTVSGYKWATCITVNEQVVHGIPTDRKLVKGDLLSIDLAVSLHGWHTDVAWSVIVGGEGEKNKNKQSFSASNFLKVGEEALWLGIKQAIDGNTIGDISNAIQTKVENEGYHIVRTLVGHGIGKKLHEDPEVPGFGIAGTGLILQAGMTLAIEVIYTEGTPNVVLSDDKWTYCSADGSLGGLFEMTVVVGKEKAEVLTDWRKV
ncbi:type I methionyl aminopeptidase [Candidatus Daviesbacteria bacterium]|nr:type I methionyl aminopeptidase [Candidatus Daviesbacteria bacterium]